MNQKIIVIKSGKATTKSGRVIDVEKGRTGEVSYIADNQANVKFNHLPFRVNISIKLIRTPDFQEVSHE